MESYVFDKSHQFLTFFFLEQKPDQECHQHHMKKVWGLM